MKKDKFTFVSYNIRTSRFNEADCSDNLNNWKYRKNAVFSLIKKQKPDIFGVQEDSKEQLNDLEGEFSKKYNVIYFEDSTEKTNEEYNALFISKKYEIIESGFKFISHTPDTLSKLKDSICYRHLTYAKVKMNEKVYLVINVHLDHSEDYSFKEVESDCFMKIVEKLFDVENLILFGDFNLIPDNNKAYHRILREYTDVSKILGVREPTHPNWLMWNVYKQIDYFWLSNNLRSSIRDFTIVKDKYKRSDGLWMEPSDHFLIRVKLSL